MQSLESQLGTAGDGHADLNDDCAAYTVMTIISRLRDGVHPGNFHCLKWGAYVRAVPHTCIQMCGDDSHGGNAPFVPINMPLDDSDQRGSLVSFPNLITLDKVGRTSTYGVPTGNTWDPIKGVMFTPGRLFFPNTSLPTPSPSRSTFAQHGQAVMDNDSRELFLRRDQFEVILWQNRQLGYDEAFIPKWEAFAMFSDGRPMGPWILGPAGNIRLREAAIYALGVLRLKRAAITPRLLGRIVNEFYFDGIPRDFTESVAEFAPLMTRSYTPDMRRKLKTIADDAGTHLIHTPVGHAIKKLTFPLQLWPKYLSPNPFRPDRRQRLAARRVSDM